MGERALKVRIECGQRPTKHILNSGQAGDAYEVLNVFNIFELLFCNDTPFGATYPLGFPPLPQVSAEITRLTTSNYSRTNLTVQPVARTEFGPVSIRLAPSQDCKSPLDETLCTAP